MLIYKHFDHNHIKHSYSIRSQKIIKMLLNALRLNTLNLNKQNHKFQYPAKEVNWDLFDPFVVSNKHLKMIFSRVPATAFVGESIIKYQVISDYNLIFMTNHCPFYHVDFLEKFKTGNQRIPLTHTKDYINSLLYRENESFPIYNKPFLIKLGFLGSNLKKMVDQFPRRITYRCGLM